jgi:hypothetical protein
VPPTECDTLMLDCSPRLLGARPDKGSNICAFATQATDRGMTKNPGMPGAVASAEDAGQSGRAQRIAFGGPPTSAVAPSRLGRARKRPRQRAARSPIFGDKGDWA